jgi:DNA-binding MurR/RpiR family transcriptional regulator
MKMLLEEVIAARREELTVSDLRLIEVLLLDKTEGSFLPAHTIAQRAGVHPSTAGRLARKLGYRSYRGMRENLRDSVLSNLDASKRVRNRVDRASGQTLLQSVIESDMRALSTLASQVEQATLDRTTQWLSEAHRILVMGEGHASSLADIFARRLKRSGYRANALAHMDWEAADELIGLTENDVLFGMIFRHENPGIERAFALAAELGAKTVLLTDSAAPPEAGIVMTVSRGKAGEFHSLTVPMAICNTLILELSRADNGYSLEALSRFETLRRTFDPTRAPRRRR